MTYKNTDLWKRAFERTDSLSSQERKASTQLSAAYDKFFERAAYLAGDIRADLPELTVHDQAHFNALWVVANQIIGSDHDLNPLEVFVFGGAVLLHDTANTVSAFENGRQDIERSPQWKDAEAKFLQAKENEDDVLTESEKKLVLLFTLRDIHAERASELHDFSVEVDGEKLSLIDDSDLRDSLGEVIGEIAASHHWNIEDLNDRFRPLIGAPAGFPIEWSIRPVLLACLLRCADATQIDASRAPRFLQGLVQPNPVSKLHWKAQERLNLPSVKRGEPETLYITSTKKFSAEDSSAWWIAYDLIVNADKELNACDALLRDLSLPTFQVRRIAGAKSPARLSEHVKTSGWEPIDAQIKVSDVSRVIELFGGEKLYGHSVHVPLRELIQNAADAIKLRRALDSSDDGYEGKITVRVNKHGDGIALEVDDDGFGMSESALIGPLIDFTSSYLNSSIATREYPGLVGQKIKRRGKFGVGFFSVFMLGKDVSVTSRRFDKSPDDARTLHFEHGLTTRPLLMKTKPKGYGVRTSTRVVTIITKAQFEALRTAEVHGVTGEQKIVPFARIVASMVPLLDVDIHVDEFGEKSQVHSADWAKQDAGEWLSEVNPNYRDKADNKRNDEYSDKLNKVVANLDMIDSDNPHYGRALIAPFAGRGVCSVDGLVIPRYISGNPNEICGVMDKKPNGPQRTNGEFHDLTAIGNWASRQAEKLSECKISEIEKYYGSYRVAHFGGNPYPIATAFLNGEVKKLEAIYQVLLSGALYAPIAPVGDGKDRWVFTSVKLKRGNITYGLQRHSKSYLHNVLEGHDANETRIYQTIPDSEREFYEHNSFLSLLSQRAIADGKAMTTEGIQNFEVAKYLGESSPFEGFKKNMIISMPVLKISLEKSAVS